ncbi:MAG: hypothetical protein VXX79_16140 [Pseudomonadota bacterium]|nr:hypothetical protein [Pseudomonadota bacterium]
MIEIAERDGKWGVVLDSPFNRRITADTPMEVHRPRLGSCLDKNRSGPRRHTWSRHLQQLW